MKGLLTQPVDAERRAAVAVLVAARWLLAVIATLSVNYRNDVGTAGLAGIDLLVAGAALLNLALHISYARRRVPLGLPLLAGLYDCAAIVCSVWLVDGFRSNNFIFLYPALLAFSLVFPGRLSLLYTATTLIAYTLVVATSHGAFRPSNPLDQKELVLRLATLAATVYVANIVSHMERERRTVAVEAEAARSAEMFALERRAREAEQTAEAERRRLSQEVHDGISQDAFMLTIGLETAQAALERGLPAAELQPRLQALLGVAKQTLLESRNLLFDLEGVMTGSESLAALLRNQTAEFTAVTAIQVDLMVEGEERPLPPQTIAEVYRVVQEGLANVFRHAGARRAGAQLHFGRHVLTLSIVDDGAGFDAQLVGRGHGLRNMRERAERVGGTMAIDSQPGRGTRLTIEIPLEDASTIRSEDGNAADPRPIS